MSYQRYLRNDTAFQLFNLFFFKWCNFFNLYRYHFEPLLFNRDAKIPAKISRTCCCVKSSRAFKIHWMGIQYVFERVHTIWTTDNFNNSTNSYLSCPADVSNIPLQCGQCVIQRNQRPAQTRLHHQPLPPTPPSPPPNPADVLPKPPTEPTPPTHSTFGCDCERERERKRREWQPNFCTIKPLSTPSCRVQKKNTHIYRSLALRSPILLQTRPFLRIVFAIIVYV